MSDEQIKEIKYIVELLESISGQQSTLYCAETVDVCITTLSDLIK